MIQCPVLFLCQFFFLKRKSVYCCRRQSYHTQHVQSRHDFVLFEAAVKYVISIFALIYNKHKGIFKLFQNKSKITCWENKTETINGKQRKQNYLIYLVTAHSGSILHKT